MQDVYIYAIPLPGTVRGVTVLKNDDYIVFVNEYLCPERQQESIEHELRHIKYNHLYDRRYMEVGNLEFEAKKVLAKA